MSMSVRKLELVSKDSAQKFTVKIAFATSDREHVDQHFGSSLGFVIYGLSAKNWQLLEVIEYSESELNKRQGHDNNKLKSRVAMLEGCVAIYCNAIGLMAIRQLLSVGVQPVQVKAGQKINSLVNDLKDELENNSRNWLNKLLATQSREQSNEQSSCKDDCKKKSQRLNDLLNESWDS
ncbi:MAG: NifB/NifX family molybdenum-iron cluster-binding protein [Colwellia sp.]